MAQQKFAVFDIDGTLVRTGLFAQVVDQLIAGNHLPPASRARLDEKREFYRIRSHDEAYKEYITEMVDVLFENLHQLQVQDYRHAVEQVVERTKDATYIYTRDLARRLKAEGYFLIALSGSEQYAVTLFTNNLGFDKAVGEAYAEENGVFTGETEDVIHNKDRLLKEIIASYDLTFSDSYGIGDTRADIPMLSLVECPIAFNPEKILFEHAKTQGWKIVIERKNTIFEIEKHGDSYCLI